MNIGKKYRSHMKAETALTFTSKEVDYIKSQHLARIATASKTGDPDVAPVGFDFDGTYFYVGGHVLTRTIKYKSVLANPKVSLVIDDLASVRPWTPRSLKIRGTADLVDRDHGYLGAAKYIRIRPIHKATININEPFRNR